MARFLFVPTLYLLLLGHGTALAQARVEERVFLIKIEDREAGRYTQKLTTYPDGTTDLEARGDVRIRVLTIHYQFSYRANERWKENHLQHLASASSESGAPGGPPGTTQHTLTVSADGRQLKVKNGAKERPLSGDAWSTSYWTLPPADRRMKPLTLVDSDTGEEHQVQLQVVGREKLRVGNQTVPCTHYRMTGTLQADLWFDGRDRLVRREMLRRGRKAVLELTSVTLN